MFGFPTRRDSRVVIKSESIGSRVKGRLPDATAAAIVRLAACSAVMALAVTGCATWRRHGVAASEQGRYRIVVLPIWTTLPEEKSATTDHEPAAGPVKEGSGAGDLRAVIAHLDDYLEQALAQSTHVLVVPYTPPEGMVFPAEPTVTDLAHLNLPPYVQSVLVVRLSGYGKLKRKWIAFLIGTGVVEGVVQGVVVAEAASNPWLGGAVALEEIGQEVLVWGGGSYLFDRAYAPVTLEAELISVADGSVVWDDTVFVSIDKDAIKKLPEEERQNRDIQLRLTAEKAVRELSADLEKAAVRNLPVKAPARKPGGK